MRIRLLSEGLCAVGAICVLVAMVLGCFMAFFVFIVKAPWVAAAFAFYCVAALVLWWATRR